MKQRLLRLGSVTRRQTARRDPVSRRGRPRLMSDAERRQRLIEAAETVFLNLGYGASAMDDIAQCAGMSKKTLYGLFDSKESLFAAVIAARRESLPAGGLGQAAPVNIESISRVLNDYLGLLARFVLAPRQVALYRLVISEAHRAPDLSRAFYCEGPERARAPLAAWLESLDDVGVLKIPDPARAAATLTAMAISELHMRVLMMGAGESVSEQDIDRNVGEAVAIFLHGCADCR